MLRLNSASVSSNCEAHTPRLTNLERNRSSQSIAPRTLVLRILGLSTALTVVAVTLIAASNARHSQTSLRSPSVDDGNVPDSSACPVFEPMPTLGHIGNRRLVESSGLVVSDENPGVLWSHNDSGARPELFALTLNGQPLADFNLSGADAMDWEDIAIGPGPKPRKRYLYIGDIGDNDRKRESVVVYRVEEPLVSSVPRVQPQTLPDVTRFELQYEGGVAHDAEALLIDPKNSDFYVITKPLMHTPVVYHAKASHAPEGTGQLVPVASLDFVRNYSVFPPLVTAADISRDGRWILVRTYLHAFLYECLPSRSVADCFRNTPCVVPLRFQPQGEAIAFFPDGRSYLTTSEGRSAAIYLFRRKS